MDTPSARLSPTAFLSYDHRDADEVALFAEAFASVFSATLSIGVGDADEFSASLDPDALIDRIAEKYLADSTITVVLIGATTWARRFVDWEIAATLSASGPPRALVGVVLRSAADCAQLPPRFESSGHVASVRPYPNSSAELGAWIDEAMLAPRASGRRNLSLLMRRDHPPN